MSIQIIENSNIVWVRHVWNLATAQISVVLPDDYFFDVAFKMEEKRIIELVFAAYSSDSIWKSQANAIRRRMTERISGTIADPNAEYLIVLRGGEIVAVSGIAKSHPTDQNLLTGICVSPAHQRKGIGKNLLGFSLVRLKQMGLASAQVYTQSGSLADEKIYPLFGSRRDAGVRYPGAEQL